MSGYKIILELRSHWMRQNRLQERHLSNDGQATVVDQLVAEGKVDPCLSHTFDEIGEAHQQMHVNCHPSGNMTALAKADNANLTPS